MGIKIKEIIPWEEISIDSFSGKIIAVDAYNALYQFLSSIRMDDGTPLRNSLGEPVSHLSGLIFRTARLVEMGIRPIYVFDGKPPELKSETIKKRISKKEEAKKAMDAALEEGDLEKARSKAQQTSKLTKPMAKDAMTLLKYLGIPFVEAPSEGEAQAAYMVQKGDAWCVASQDFDAVLFGAPILVRNLTLSGKRKLPYQKRYVTVSPEIVYMENVVSNLNLTREQMIDMAILMGTDYNDGIRGIGPKKALAAIREHGNLKNALSAMELSIESCDEIKNTFLLPQVSDDYSVSWGDVEKEKVLEFMVEKNDFSNERISKVLDIFIKSREEKAQKTLDKWF